MASTIPAPPSSRAAEAQGREIIEAIQQASDVIRVRDTLRGTLWALTMVLGTMAACLLALRLSGAGSLLLRLIWLAGFFSCGWVLFRRVVQPLIFKVQPLYVAHEIERHLPDCKNSLINWLDLRDSNLPAAVKIAVANRALRDLEGVEPAELVRDNAPPSRVKWALIACASVLVLLVATAKGNTLNRLAEALMPFDGGGFFRRTQITLLEPKAGNGSIRLGQDCLVRVMLQGELPAEGSDQTPALHFKHQEGAEPQTVLFLADKDPDGRSVWSAVVHRDQVLQGFWYWVTAGDAKTATYRIDVRLDAFLEKLEAEIAPPVYLARKPFPAESLDLSVTAGTTITLTGTASQDLDRVAVLFQRDQVQGKPDRILGKVSADNPRLLTATLPAVSNGTYSLELTTREGDVAVTPPHNLKITPDNAPSIQLVSPTTEAVQVRIQDKLDLQVEATDDNGLASLTASWVAANNTRVPMSVGANALMTARPQDMKKSIKATWKIDPQALPLPDGKTVGVQPGATFLVEIEAHDHQPDGLGKVSRQLKVTVPRNQTQVRVMQPEGGHKTLRKGQSLFVSARISGRIPKPEDGDAPRVLIRREEEDAPNLFVPLAPPKEGGLDGIWSAVISSDQVAAGMWYQVAAGDGVSPLYRVEIPAPLAMKSLTGQVIPPAYTGWKPALFKDRVIRGLRGSTVELKLESSVINSRGTLRFTGTDGQSRELPMANDPQRPAFLGLKFPLDQAGTYQLSMAADDQAWKDATPFPIELVEDASPHMELSVPGKDTEASLGGTLAIKGKATDDVGVQSVTLRARVVDGSELAPLPYLKGRSLRDKGGSLPRDLEYVEVLDFQKLQTADGKPANLQAGQVIEYWAEARDAHPDPKHPSGLSSRFKVTLKAQEDPKRDDQQKQKDLEQKKEAEQKQEQQQQQNNQGQGEGQGQGQGDQGKPDQNQKKNGQGENPNDKPMGVMGDKQEDQKPGQKEAGMGNNPQETPMQGEKAQPGNNPTPGQANQPQQGDNTQPANQPMPGQGDQPRQGNKPQPGDPMGNKDINEIENKINEALGEKPIPGQGDKPGQGMGEKPGQGMGEKPGQGMGEKPGQGMGEKPGQGMGEKPGQGMGEKPGQGMGEKPGQGMGEKPGQGMGEKPGQGMGEKPGQGMGEKPGQGTGEKPGQGMGEKPGQGMGEKPGQGTGEKPGQGMGEKPGQGMGEKPGQGMGEKPGQGTGEKPGQEMGEKPGQGMGEKPGQGMGEKPGQGTGEKPGQGMGEKPGQGMGEKPGQGMGEKPGQGMGEKPGQGTGEKPGQGMGEKPGQGMGEKPGQGTGEKPGQGMGEKPGQGMGEKPGQGTGEKPGQGMGEKPGQGTGEKPGQGMGEKPGQGMGEKPGQSMGEKPGQGMGEKPGQGMGEKPGQGMGEKPGQGMGEKPGQGMGEKPGQGMGEKPGQGMGEKPGQGTGEKPGQGMGEKPGQGMGEKPGQGTGEKPGQGMGEKPGQGMGEKPGQGTGEKPGQGMGEKPGQGMGEKPGQGMGEKPGQGMGEKPSQGMGEKPGQGMGEKPGQGMGEKPGQGMGEKPGQGMGEKPGQGMGEKPGQGMGEKPSQGMGEKPGQGMGEKPGQGMGEKPGQGMGEKPGQGMGEKPGQGMGEKPGQGMGEKPGQGMGEKPGQGMGEKPGQGNQPGMGEQADPNAKPGEGRGADPRVGPGGKDGAGTDGASQSGSRGKADAPDAESKKATLAQIESLEDQIRKNKDKLKQKGMSDEEIAKYQETLRNRKEQVEKSLAGDDKAAPQAGGSLGSVGARQATGRPAGSGQIQGENRPEPPAEYRDAWREFSRKRKAGSPSPGTGTPQPR